MRMIPVDVSRLKFVVVGEPAAQMRDSVAAFDRNGQEPLWNLDLTVIGEGRAETVQFSLPEGGFPKDLGVGAMNVPEEMVAVTWEKNGRSGVMVRTKSRKVEGGSAGVRGVTA